MQSPDSEVKTYFFETGIDDQDKVNKLLKEINKSLKSKAAGEEFKSARQLCEDLDVTMDQLKMTMKAEKDAKSFVIEGKILSGKPWVHESGKIVKIYSRAGELMVQCIEDAYKNELKFHVPITGEYLAGRTWGDAH